MPFEIANYQRFSGCGVSVPQQFCYLFIAEVMQKQGAKYEVKAPRRERKLKSVGNYLGHRGGFAVDQIVIKTRNAGGRIGPLNDTRRISGSRAYVQQGECLLLLHNPRQGLKNCRMAPKAAINPDQILQIDSRFFRFGVVQQFGLNVAL